MNEFIYDFDFQVNNLPGSTGHSLEQCPHNPLDPI